MGCDIHCAIERRDSFGYWRFVAPLELGRNYHLFGILAGVRTDHDPIAPQRGLPADLDSWSRTSTDSECEPMGTAEFGDHSRSWLTLAELRTYDWSTLLDDCGVIPLRPVDWETWGNGAHLAFPEPYEPYTEWRNTPPHRPRGSCAGLSGAHILNLRGGNPRDEALAEQWIANPQEMPTPQDPPPGAIYRDQTGGSYGWQRGEKRPRTAYACVRWQVVAKDACQEFYDWVQQQKASPDDLRIVFGFDS